MTAEHMKVSNKQPTPKRNTNEAEIEAYLAKGKEITRCSPRVLLRSHQIKKEIKMAIWREQHPDFGVRREPSEYDGMTQEQLNAKLKELEALIAQLEEEHK